MKSGRARQPWHAALLTGGACRDAVIGGHTLDQASAYSFIMGFNGAARDPLQHALPLVYSEPDLALSVLRNTCAWAAPNGDLPYALDGAKRPWTAAHVDMALGWDEWRRMSLAAHAQAYPGVWEGTLSGPDAYNAPESPRPGRTWASQLLVGGMQAFPVSNLHSHAQPLLAYLRLVGVEPTPRGTLKIGGGARWRSRTFRVEEDGHGQFVAQGPVVLETVHGEVRGGPGIVSW